jgi:hypothetical protein
MASTISISQWRIGECLVPLDTIIIHSRQRRPDPSLIRKIKADLDNGIDLKEANKVILLLPKSEHSHELEKNIRTFNSNAGELHVPPGITFLCIDGQHRITAAKQHLKEAENRTSGTVPITTRCWWAEIYHKGMENESEFTCLRYMNTLQSSRISYHSKPGWWRETPL